MIKKLRRVSSLFAVFFEIHVYNSDEDDEFQNLKKMPSRFINEHR